MIVEEKLQQAKSQFPTHTVNKEKFVDSFWTKVERLETMPRAEPRHRRLVVSAATIVLASGIVVSPMIASALQQVPLVHVVLNWARGTDVAPYVRNVQQSATDHGITMTITDVLYGPSQLSFGYIVSPGQPSIPHGGAVQLGTRYGMKFFVNGKPVQLQGVGQDEATQYGFKGLVTLTNDGTTTTLPSTFNLQIVLHKIGNQRGTWKFDVPVSRTDMAPKQSFLPMVTKQIGNETLTIKEVQLYPTGGMVDYDVTVPVRVLPSLNMGILNQNKDILDTVSANPGTAKSQATHGGFETWSYSQPFRIPGRKPTALIVAPILPANLEPRFVPLTGPFPVSVTNGVFGKLVITGADVKGSTVTVHYESPNRPNRPGFGFSIENKTHPKETFGGSLGEKVGPSGSDTYVNVYHFSNDVSSDTLVLRLPLQTQDNVFQVPLRHNSK